jgi:predicted nucleic acid-binding protein
MPELADTSVWARRRHPRVQPWFTTQLLLDEIGISTMVELELLHTARGSGEFDEMREELDSLPQAPIGPMEWRRAVEVMQKLAHARGGPLHRAVKPADLLIAAAAEKQGWTLVHYDSDYDLIAGVTAQPARWVAPRGSL